MQVPNNCDWMEKIIVPLAVWLDGYFDAPTMHDHLTSDQGSTRIISY